MYKKYYSGLNGLRAISIASVVIFHGNLDISFISSFGWLGVDLFFVISGFLITGILLESRQKKDFFQFFYIRRSLRIFPLYYLFLLFITLYIYFKANLSTDILYYFFYLQNFYAVSEGAHNYSVLAHTWSLAVEEQFYLFWPLVIYLLNNKQIRILGLIIVVMTPMLRFYFAINDWGTYYQNSLIITRIDSLVWGSLLTLFMRDKINSLYTANFSFNCLIVIGLVGFIGILIGLGHGSFWRGINSVKENVYLNYSYGHMLFTFVAMVFTGVIGKISFQTSNIFKKISNLLEMQPFNYIGKISYGLYIYHIPIFILLNKLSPIITNEYILFVIKVGLTFFVSSLSWKLFETRFIKMKERFAFSENTNLPVLLKDHC